MNNLNNNNIINNKYNKNNNSKFPNKYNKYHNKCNNFNLCNIKCNINSQYIHNTILLTNIYFKLFKIYKWNYN